VLEALRLRCFFFNEKKSAELVNNAFMAYYYYFFSLKKELRKYSKKELKKQKNSFKMTAKKCKQFLSFKHKLLGCFPHLYFIAIKCKKSLINIYRGLKKFFFCHNKRIMKMRFSKKEKCILLDTPLHGNLGDQAIALAERNYLKENFPHHSVCEFDFNECSNYLNYIKKYIKKSDIIFIQGGGFIGSLWPNEQRMFINLLSTFKENKIIVFPQTVYFYKEDQALLKECVEVMNSCSNLIFFTREKKSYDFMNNQGFTCKIDLIPDIVLYLSYKPKKTKKNGKVLLCFRQDKEKICSQDNVIGLLQNLNIEFDETDTVIYKEMKKKKFAKEVFSKLQQFSNYSLVICDRLHAMIFSSLVGTPCIAFDNLSHKVSGVYEWIKDLDYIQCISEKELNANLIMDMMKKENRVYYRENLVKEYYNKIIEWCGKNEN